MALLALRITHALDFLQHYRDITTWFMGDKSPNGTTFVLSDGNTIRYTIDHTPGMGLLQGREQVMLIRVYPEVSSAPGQPPVGAPTQRSATGFFIASDLVATNYHVVADCKDIRLILSDGTEVAGIAAVCDPANDLALIRTNRHVDQVTALPVGDPLSVRGGGRVYTIGFPMPDDLGVNAKVSEGIVNSITGMDDDPRMYQISIPIQPGNSGGPLLDSKGGVIGVVTSTLNNVYAFRRQGTVPQNVNFAVKINYLDNLIAVLPGGAQVSRRVPDKELDVTEIMTSVRPAIVLILAKG
jgi:serine protease Do